MAVVVAGRGVAMQIFAKTLSGRSVVISSLEASDSIASLKAKLASAEGVPAQQQRLVFACRALQDDGRTLGDYGVEDGCTLTLLLALRGGMDMQNRAGSKPGAGGVASGQNQDIDRRERLRKLALDTIDLSKDPYFMKNHLGTFECKLCLTLHNNEGNYLAHTQGKRHQQNLARRAAKEARDEAFSAGGSASALDLQRAGGAAVTIKRRTIKIGRPGYRVTKQRDPETGQRCLLFQVDYPEIEATLQPRHRFMSAYEQRVEPPDKAFQYVVFAAEPYENIAFKIPNLEVDKSEGRFFTNWDREGKSFTLQLYFKLPAGAGQQGGGGEGPAGGEGMDVDTGGGTGGAPKPSKPTVWGR